MGRGQDNLRQNKTISRNQTKVFEYFLKAADASIIIACALIVSYIQFDSSVPKERYFVLVIALLFVTINVFSWFSVYRQWRGIWLFKELTQITIAWACVGLILGTCMFLGKVGENFSRLWTGWTFMTTWGVMISFRILIRLIAQYNRSIGLNQKHVVIVGAGVLGKRACRAMLRESWAGLKPVAFFDDDPTLSGTNYKGVKVMGVVDDIIPFIESRRSINPSGNSKSEFHSVAQVWIALPLYAGEQIEKLQDALKDTAASVYFLPDLYSFNLVNYSVDEIAGIPVMNMSASPMEGGAAAIKRLEDIIISSLLLLITSPLFLVLTILIKWGSPGPIFFKQRRYGQDGKEFMVWKFRSMHVIEDGGVITQATRDDDRTTKIGRLIRKLSIDELPQLINVLQGKMSLVGPRPHAVAHNEYYRDKVQGYMARHQIKPGITGWAQVNGCRGETPKIEDMEERVRYDMEYIRNWSLPFDIRILFKTFKTIIDTKNTY